MERPPHPIHNNTKVASFLIVVFETLVGTIEYSNYIFPQILLRLSSGETQSFPLRWLA